MRDYQLMHVFHAYTRDDTMRVCVQCVRVCVVCALCLYCTLSLALEHKCSGRSRGHELVWYRDRNVYDTIAPAVTRFDLMVQQVPFAIYDSEPCKPPEAESSEL